MKTFLDCVPCFIRQALDAVRLATSDNITHERVLRGVMDAAGRMNFKECSDVFRRQFDKADLVISKGQGNYETLSDVEKNIFFILKAKCPVIAQHIGCDLGSLIIISRRKEAA
jgi:uncharacterized protein with ATP-grasp and redox domains